MVLTSLEVQLQSNLGHQQLLPPAAVDVGRQHAEAKGALKASETNIPLRRSEWKGVCT